MYFSCILYSFAYNFFFCLEFLFEALSSDNQTLVRCVMCCVCGVYHPLAPPSCSAVLQCLSSMATVEDFYTGCHAVYGKIATSTVAVMVSSLLQGLTPLLKLCL